MEPAIIAFCEFDKFCSYPDVDVALTGVNMAQHPITNSTLNTAEPTMVPKPTSER